MSHPIARTATLYVVDDDASMRDSLALMLGLMGYRTALFDTAEGLLTALRADCTGCVIADLRLPGKNGLELLTELRARGIELPFVIITAHGDVATARAAFQAEAVDFLEKPFEKAQLQAAIEKGLSKESRRIERIEAERESAARLAQLTRREREVLDLVAQGLHAKEIGRALAISSRTVEVHKASLMSKLGARNVAELVRFALAGDQRQRA